MIVLDGSRGEGGGQILRTALTLSMISGQPFRIDRLRAGRRKPGLLRQHLTCVNAAREICSARVTGGEMLSQKVSFEPGAVKAGAYVFDIGTAGATGLVFQTVLPALLSAKAASTVKLSGGTHAASAPSYDYIDRVYLPLLARMGASVTTNLERPGFYPAGGGSWQASIEPLVHWTPLTLEAAGDVVARRIAADVSHLPYDIAERQAARVADLLSWPPDTIAARTVKSPGPGNVLAVEIVAEHVKERFTAFGERGISAEAVADIVVVEVRDYLAAAAPVGPHLADQLLLPMALAGSGAIVTCAPTLHTRTNIEVIEKFLPVEFEVSERDDKRWRIAVSR